jgi:predicted PurR-regulated permease PerM
LLGVLGALVAIPIAATIPSLLRDVWRFRREDQGDDHEVAVAPTAAEPAS